MTRPVRRIIVSALALGLAALAPALAQAPVPSDRAARIVALGGVVTEIVADLGLADRIAAADTTSVFPSEILRIRPSVGYLRQLSAEGILSVRPTLVLAVEGAGPPDVLTLVEGAGVPIVRVPEEPSEAGVVTRIRAVAEAVGAAEAGRRLAAATEAQFAALASERARLGGEVRALFILSAQNGRVMVGGRGTTADGMIRLAGATNAADAVEGYKPMTDEALVAARPDVVVMMQAGPSGRPSTDILAGPALSQTPAGREGRLVVMDGLYLLGFGPRTPAAARDLMTALRKREP